METRDIFNPECSSSNSPLDQIHEILADELIALVQQLTTEIQNH